MTSKTFVSMFVLALLSTPRTWAEDLALARLLEPLISAHQGEVSVAVEHLETGAEFRFNADKPMPTASLIKLPILVTVYRRADEAVLDVSKVVTLQDEDKVPGSGVLTSHLSEGARFSLRDCIRLMIAFSDNTATNLVLDEIGIESIAEEMAGLGLAQTKLNSKVFRRSTSIFPERSVEFGLGSTTAAEMIRLLQLLHRGVLANESSTSEMLAHLQACEDRTKLARFLPEGVTIAHKTGGISRARCDAGIITTATGPVAVCVLTAKNRDRTWGEDNAANRLCAEIGRAVFEHFGGQHDSIPELEDGDTGELVESLQSTLNARLEPPPRLAVDGDFGPNTKVAVQRFQEQKGLPVTGKVGPQTWAALGDLVQPDSKIPAPEFVNQESLPRSPQPPLDGPPIVTCRAWAIGHAEMGELLWESNAAEKLQPASTTKIMTALVVMDYAERHPEVLNESVVFSIRADRTIGSTAGVRAGESLPVRELLYGLLLPSGNDAAVALAEYFGERMAREKGASPATAVEQFVDSMNTKAAELGMSETRFLNPHGLSDSRHVVSARDLLKLAWHALQNETLRDIVNTPQRGCTVKSRQGYERNLLWKNTNKLLSIEDYSGVKTGTTRAAGACLVSTGQRNGDSLIVVVLGASSSPARYADTRNLFRWAWKRREGSTH